MRWTVGRIAKQGLRFVCGIAMATQLAACGGGSGSGSEASIPPTPPPPATRFFATASMSTARAYHTATLLQNGTVLVTGGTDVNGKALASAEIFDPFNDRFTPTGDMVSARTYHSATLLQDGRVFLDGGDETGTKELFDPSSKTFTPIGTATGKTAGLNAALRNDGVVVVRGPAITVCQPSTGCATGGAAIVLFDPLAGSFTSPGGSSGHAFLDQTMTLLEDDRLLVAGGRIGTRVSYTNGTSEVRDLSVNTAELVDPERGTARPTANISARHAHAAALLDDGRVLIAGGMHSYQDAIAPVQSVTLADAELFDPVSETFKATGRMQTARQEHAMTRLTSGAVLVTGGTGASGQRLGTAELFDPTTGTFESMGSMVSVRSGNRYSPLAGNPSTGYSATALKDGRALIVGGISNGAPVATAELFQ